MSPPDAPTRDGGASALRAAPLDDGVAEVARVMAICNACRYCEGYCAVFPSMTRRLEFGRADVHYLANLCHSCGACLHACQYAPPHEFAVNVPRAMAKVRMQTYVDYAWPVAFAGLYRRNGVTLASGLAASLALFLLLVLGMKGTLFGAMPEGNFYNVFPHDLLVGMFAPVFLFAVLALWIGASRFWRDVDPGRAAPPVIGETTLDVLRLKYLDGGHGSGCNNDDDAFSLWRRRFHHCTFYGFLLCFASTGVAAIYHYAFGWKAPYDLNGLPVILGTAGGIGLLIGPAGLTWLNLRRHPLHGEPAQKPMDLGFLMLLFLTAGTGLALMLWRGSSALPTLLAVHLGAVMALFLTLPYGKFAHGFYRIAAVLKWNIEKRRPSNLLPGEE